MTMKAEHREKAITEFGISIAKIVSEMIDEKAKELQTKINTLKKFEDYSYYVGTEITVNSMPKKYSIWLRNINPSKEK